MPHEQLHWIAGTCIQIGAGSLFIIMGLFAEPRLKDGLRFRTKGKRVLWRAGLIALGTAGVYLGLGDLSQALRA